MEIKDAVNGAVKKRGVHLEVRPVGDDKYEVVHIGHPELKNFIAVGDHVRSSDLDDFENDGYKVHEVE